MQDRNKPKPALDHDVYGTRECVVLEDVKPGMLVIPCGVRGPKTVVQLADCRHAELSKGPMLIAQIQATAPNVGEALGPTNMGVFVKWKTLYNVDTRGCQLHDLVYLGEEGKWSFAPGEHERIIGKVLRIGEAQGSDSGVILLET